MTPDIHWTIVLRILEYCSWTGLHWTSDPGTAPSPVILASPATRGLYESQGPGLTVAVVKVEPALVEELSLQSYRLAQLTGGQRDRFLRIFCFFIGIYGRKIRLLGCNFFDLSVK